MKHFLFLVFIITLTTKEAFAEVPARLKDIVKKTGITEGEYQPLGGENDKCQPLLIRFIYPENKSLSIINGSHPLFESVGSNDSSTERGCKRTIQSKLESNKISQNIEVVCQKKANYKFFTSSEFKNGKLHIVRKVTEGKEVKESSSCQYARNK